MKKVILISIIGIVFLGTLCGCVENQTSSNNSKNSENSAAGGDTITILCGAGLMKPMNELVKNFEEKTGAKVHVHYGGSAELFGVLSTTGGDVFIPGAYKYTKDAMDRGLVLNDTVKNITYHVPTIAVPKGNPKNIKSLNDLTKPGVKIVIGDPKACAIGKVAKNLFEKNHIWKNISKNKNIIMETPTANQLLIYIATNQADAAIIWEDMTTWAQSKGKIDVIEIPKNENIIKTIPTAVAAKSKNPKLAKEFNDYISSDEAKTIWKKWGFEPCN
ncbi:molybdate ABC transporter substrate-binding protein [Methanothermococcus sp.]|uniref:molybdate ABC transporter substrate-binding protein n=1 Tax=Methanothermococcus sp. TaxID=2614238 RepID=UPI0025F868C8|nr:molybdate ABC transporter substrate-binding protein [Methanothermococcus sp.]